MTQRAAETLAFRLSRRAADYLKIDFLFKKWISILRKNSEKILNLNLYF
jgi:hypothetical protein